MADHDQQLDEFVELSCEETVQVQGGDDLAADDGSTTLMVGELPDIPIFRLPKK